MINTLIRNEWLKKLLQYNNLYVGLSGGLDSTVLLHSLAKIPELFSKLKAIHIHHGLNENASLWEEHCKQFCEQLSIPLIVRHVTIDNSANIEERAREARFDAFSLELAQNDLIILAHHCDDQAETLLLNLFRGAGINGLAAMPKIKKFGLGAIARPFLDHSRKTLSDYAVKHKLLFVDDPSNQDPAFSRNYLRNNIMPLLQEKWPKVVSNLVRTTNLCQEAKANLYTLAELDCSSLLGNTLNISSILSFEPQRISNILRAWLHNNEVRPPSFKVLSRIINEVIYASVDATPLVEWGNVAVRRYKMTLYLDKSNLSCSLKPRSWEKFPDPLQLDLNSNNSSFLHAKIADKGLQVAEGSNLEVRFREGGEIFYWRKQQKDLKKLFQQWSIPPWLRDSIPLLYINDELAAVVGYAISDHYLSSDPFNTYNVTLTRHPERCD